MPAIDTDADRNEMLSAGDFGEVIRVDGKKMRGVPFTTYAEAQDVEGLGLEMAVLTSEVPSVAHGSEVKRTVAGVVTEYTVRGVQPDGYGFTRLVLESV